MQPRSSQSRRRSLNRKHATRARAKQKANKTAITERDTKKKQATNKRTAKTRAANKQPVEEEKPKLQTRNTSEG